MTVTREPRHGREHETRRQVGRHSRVTRARRKVVRELREQATAHTLVEEVGQVWCFARAALHRVGGAAGLGEQIVQLADDLADLRGTVASGHGRRERAPERANADAFRESRLQARDQQGAVRCGDRESSVTGEIAERVFRNQQK